MIFYGQPIETTVPGVQLMGATSWIRQAPPNAKMECRNSEQNKLECRPVGSSGVLALQQALAAMAAATGDARYDPGKPDGIIGFGTRKALSAALLTVGPSLSSALKIISAGIAVAAATGQVDDQIKTAAPGLTAAISLYTIKLAPTAPIIDPSMLPAASYPMTTGTPWYMQTSGKIAIGIGAVALLLLVLRK